MTMPETNDPYLPNRYSSVPLTAKGRLMNRLFELALRRAVHSFDFASVALLAALACGANNLEAQEEGARFLFKFGESCLTCPGGMGSPLSVAVDSAD